MAAEEQHPSPPVADPEPPLQKSTVHEVSAAEPADVEPMPDRSEEAQAPEQDSTPSDALEPVPAAPSDAESPTGPPASREESAGDIDPAGEDLFHPHDGGPVIQRGRCLFSDGWGDWFSSTDTGSGALVLLRVLKGDLLPQSLWNAFVESVAEKDSSMLHDNLLPFQASAWNYRGDYCLVHPYFPMTLKQLLESGKKQDFSILMQIARQVVSALSFAHSHLGQDGKMQRTSHLHLQPSQILLSQDFALSAISGTGYAEIYRRITGADRPRWQDYGMDPAYAPPEFYRFTPGSAEEAVDIYSLGVLLYQLVTGQLPFEGPSVDDYKFQHAKTFPAPPRLLNQSVEDWMEDLILKCLEKNPEDRWTTVGEIDRAFIAGMA